MHRSIMYALRTFRSNIPRCIWNSSTGLVLYKMRGTNIALSPLAKRVPPLIIINVW